MPERLSARGIETLVAPKTGRLQLTDTDVKGLTFRLTAKGEASWSLQMRVGGKIRRFTIGPYPNISLSEARNRAARMRIDVMDGADPVAEKRKAREEKAKVRTIGEALELYDKIHLTPNLRRAPERLRQLNEVFAKSLKSPIADVSRADLQKFLDLKGKTAPISANRYRAGLSAFLQWCLERGMIETNPALATRKATKERARDRVLTDTELKAIWEASKQQPLHWTRLLQVMVLTAQRRNEVARMKWESLDFENARWNIGQETKNERPHIVHLSSITLEILQNQYKDRLANSPYVFSSSKATPLSTFSKVKLKLDIVSGVSDWRFHDFRRTFATQMAEAGYDETLVDRILNHVAAGSRTSTVARVYNRSERLEERKEILDGWAWHVTKELVSS